jgi:hypothetical protein
VSNVVGRGGNVSIVLGSSEAKGTRAAWSERGDGNGIESKDRCDRGVVGSGTIDGGDAQMR